MSRKLRATALRWTCDPAACAPDVSTDEVMRGGFGQTRALAALRLGLEIASPGYNVFVAGEPGCGRMSSVEELLAEIRSRCSIVRRDIAYVHDFDEPSRPKLLWLPSGRGKAFETAMSELVATARAQIPALFESDAFRAERDALVAAAEAEGRRLHEELQSELTKAGLDLVMVESGPVSMPDIFAVAGGKPQPPIALRSDPELAEAYVCEEQARRGVPGFEMPSDSAERSALVAKELDALDEKIRSYAARLEVLLRVARQAERRIGREIAALESKMAKPMIDQSIADLASEFPGEHERAHLDRVAKHILAHLEPFKGSSDENEAETGGVAGELEIYGVNVILDSSGSTQPPIVVEPNPTFTNLVGTIDTEIDRDGVRGAGFRGIHAGSLVQAQNGYLVMYAGDVFDEPGVWRMLVRTLRSGRLQIQPPELGIHISAPRTPKPEPIPLDVKVVLIGDENLYELLSAAEEDFKKTFKVKAEFDASVPNTPENLACFSALVRRMAEREKLAPFERDAIAAVAEYAARGAGARTRLSTRFGDIIDVLRESSYYAGQRGDGATVDALAVRAAIRARRERHALADSKLDELFRDRALVIQTSGVATGQINGLAVIGASPHWFGRAQRITAAVGMGRRGVVNIEREANLSGPIHDKGVLILAGYLREKYGARRRLAITASIAFEQSYGEVDGDSASLAELYCLLSAISGLPIRQSIAVTGSVDQLGRVQAVGAVNEKIEGFYKLCSERGLRGHCGVVIPRANVRALMLDPEVVRACAERRFFVHAIRNIDEGIPIVFGVSAESLHARGSITAHGAVSDGAGALKEARSPARAGPARSSSPAASG